ncbi:hypothetical protein [Candidatus Nasuia deltocephalinicola]|uniref:hypothetical protein n=1 Tax=Candidatus Nasuia deltocephalincola TaxID=1160784 RepID=UPI00216AD572|nr:hypothetical protein [Candidatus Nasuia deltocephalinicola]
MNKIIIFIDNICKKKFIINSNLKIFEKIEIKKKNFNLKKVNISLISYKMYKKNKEIKKIKILNKFNKKYIY